MSRSARRFDILHDVPTQVCRHLTRQLRDLGTSIFSRKAVVKTRTDPVAPMDIVAPVPLGARGAATEHMPRSISSTHSAKPRLRMVSNPSPFPRSWTSSG